MLTCDVSWVGSWVGGECVLWGEVRERAAIGVTVRGPVTEVACVVTTCPKSCCVPEPPMGGGGHLHLGVGRRANDAVCVLLPARR